MVQLRIATAGIALTTALCSFAVPEVAEGQITIRVPADFGTIQGAIAAASAGDTVLVSAGTYPEEIDFLGKDIEVVSESGPAVTIIDPSAMGAAEDRAGVEQVWGEEIDDFGRIRLIDLSSGVEVVGLDGRPTVPPALGGNNGSVVLFGNGETRAAVLDGFTVTGGAASSEGGGIRIQGGASPTVRNNLVIGNTACSGGAGIAVAFSSPLIEDNEISNNQQSGCSGGSGGGIYLRGAGSAELRGNEISNNGFSSGGGISFFAAGTPVVTDNLILGNTATSGGGGLDFANTSNALLVQNVVAGNTGADGDGVEWLVPSGQPGPRWVNNTIVWNATVGIFADGFDAGTELENNVIVATPSQTAVECGNFNDTNTPDFDFNNVFADGGTAYGGFCADLTGTDGNISADPLFVAPGSDDFRLASGSPSVDVGNNVAADLPAVDLDGNQRIFDGDGDEDPVIDQGAYEQGSEPPPPPKPEVHLVPAELPTIQQAIDAAANSDTVLVAAGTYVETIDFLGKAISVISESGPAQTVIDGGLQPLQAEAPTPLRRIQRRVVSADGVVSVVVESATPALGSTGSVVTFNSGEGRASVLEGFTVTGGNADFFGGGILIENASPTVRNNLVTGNLACTGGAGISVSSGGPLIVDNTISNNHQAGCSGGQGGGIRVSGSGSLEIRGNDISGNSFSFAGGIGFNAAGSPLVIDNRIHGNSADNVGGVEMINSSNVVWVQNRFEGNDSADDEEGEDLGWLVPSGQPGPRLVNNTFYATGTGPSLWLDGFDAGAELSNNIVHGAMGAAAVHCGSFGDTHPPAFDHNNVYSPSGTAYSGLCGDPTGVDGNLSADPLFVDGAGGDLHLQAGSPSIDAGDDSVMSLPSEDFEGEDRISNGDGVGPAVVDQGVDEVQETPIFADGFESGDTSAWGLP